MADKDKEKPAPKPARARRTIEVLLLVALLPTAYRMYTTGAVAKLQKSFSTQDVSAIVRALGDFVATAAPSYGFWFFVVVLAYIVLQVLRKIF